jgi:hypothetical protein
LVALGTAVGRLVSDALPLCACPNLKVPKTCLGKVVKHSFDLSNPCHGLILALPTGDDGRSPILHGQSMIHGVQIFPHLIQKL